MYFFVFKGIVSVVRNVKRSGRVIRIVIKFIFFLCVVLLLGLVWLW